MANDDIKPPENKENYFKKLWKYRKYLVIEPFFFFYMMASIFNAVAIQNFPMEKACRVNLGYSKIVCTTMLDKSELDIDCDSFTFENTTLGPGAAEPEVTLESSAFNYTVCKGEIEAQQMTSEVTGIRAPISAIIPLIVLLFAGGWADRYNKRKTCMIVPIIGEGLAFLCLLLSALFFNAVPMEIGYYIETIVPSLFGSSAFIMMAVFSYITIATPEEDRLFRFGIFSMFTMAIPFIGQPISGYLYQKLGYIWSFSMSFSFQVIAILYIIFFIEEVNQAPESSSENGHNLQGIENSAYDGAHSGKNGNDIEMSTAKNATNTTVSSTPVTPEKRSFLREFFDPQLVLDCIRFPQVKRENNGRLILNLLILAYFLTVGPPFGENDYWYRYTLKKLKWNGNDFSIYLSISSGTTLLGTFIGSTILSKMMKCSDPTVAILSAIVVVISRILYSISKTTTSFYVASLIEMFISMRAIAIRAIGASIIDGDELGKMYSIFGISEPIAQFIFPPIYSAIYIATVESFTGAVFLFSNVFNVPNVLVFIFCYIVVRRRKSKIAKDNAIAEANANASAGENTHNALPSSSSRAITGSNGVYIKHDNEFTRI